ncbi:hypothetical protein VTJ49DRAFT_2669 [Mycothermus thermophilus]|uniref:Uncharacterized protein n=1 Tax=Humicola insolens TaxID=85995 RepID=A0ABR3V9P5_HUMIN
MAQISGPAAEPESARRMLKKLASRLWNCPTLHPVLTSHLAPFFSPSTSFPLPPPFQPGKHARTAVANTQGPFLFFYCQRFPLPVDRGFCRIASLSAAIHLSRAHRRLFASSPPCAVPVAAELASRDKPDTQPCDSPSAIQQPLISTAGHTKRVPPSTCDPAVIPTLRSPLSATVRLHRIAP